MSLSPGIPGNPYVGPRAFRAGERLFGREHETAQLLNLIVAERIVLMYSPSGAGKTSLIQAALIPRLQTMKFRVLPIVRVNFDPASAGDPGTVTDCNRYIFSTLLSLEEGLPDAQRSSASRLARMSLSEHLSHQRRPEGDRGIDVLIFDQFEEILTLNPADVEAKHDFFKQLGAALEDPRRWALVAMREVFIAALDPYALPIPSRFGNRFRLDLLSQGEARQAVQQPAQLAGVAFDDAAASKLVDDLRRVRVQQADGSMQPQLGAYIEPVQLQVVCHRLWEMPRPNPNKITEHDLAGLEQVDQSLVDESLADYYAKRVATAAGETGTSERSIREWFDRYLITEQGIRGTVPMGPAQSAGLDNHVIGRLVNAYLVRGEKRSGVTWFELSHDRLIGPVRADNDAWFKANLSLLQQQADVWSQQGRPEGLLMRGQTLSQANAWAAGHATELLPAEVDFLASSLEQEARAVRLRRRNQAISVLAVVAILLAALALLAFRQAAQEREVAEQQTRAARSGQLAAQSQAALETFPLRSLLLAVEAARAPTGNEPHPAAAEDALRTALKDSHGALISTHEAPVNNAAFSADGHWLALGDAEGRVQLWDVRGAQSMTKPMILSDDAHRAGTLDFSPKGRWLAAGSKDGKVWLWNVQTSNPAEQPVMLSGFQGDAHALAFSPDERWLAAGGLDGTIRLWDIRMPDPTRTPITYTGHTGPIRKLAFSPDGRWLASGSGDKTARLWDMQAPDPAERSVQLAGHEGLVSTLAFSPDSRWLVTGSNDKTARLWDTQAADPAGYAIALSGHQNLVNHVAFSPDGRWLATGSGDKTVRLWDMRAANPAAYPLLLRGHASGVHSLAFSPDGHQLATGSEDRTVRLWDVAAPDPAADPLVLRGHDDRITALAFSPDGRRLVTGSEDRTARLWVADAIDPKANPQARSGHMDQINTLAFSPDGRMLAAAGGDKEASSKDNSARVWGVNDAGLMGDPLALNGHTNWIHILAFSPDGRWLASGSQDATVRLWDLQATAPSTAPLTLTLTGHTDRINALAFSPDGRWLASGSRDAAQVWDLRAADPSLAPRTLKGHTDFINALAISPDGRWLATGGSDKAARLWDMRAADPDSHPAILSGHADRVNSLAFSPDGRWLATGSDDRTVRLWDMRATNPAATPVLLPGHAGPVDLLAFSQDGGWLAAGADSADGQIQLWDLSASDPTANPIKLSSSGPVYALAFSPNSRWLATGGEDGKVRLWLIGLDELINLACQSAGRNFTQAEWRTFFPQSIYRKTCPQWPDGK